MVATKKKGWAQQGSDGIHSKVQTIKYFLLKKRLAERQISLPSLENMLSSGQLRHFLSSRIWM